MGMRKKDSSSTATGGKWNKAGADGVCGRGKNPGELSSGFFFLCDMGGAAATEERKWGEGVNK